MASIDTRTFPASGFSAREGFSFTVALARALAAVQNWNDARVTRKSLSRLSERELDDIGLCRGDIDRIARLGADA